MDPVIKPRDDWGENFIKLDFYGQAIEKLEGGPTP